MFDRYGDESVLSVRNVVSPDPAPNEVQVRVRVASLNPIDFKLRSGLYRLIRRPKLPAITGKDFAGRIAAFGADVAGFSVGQRVFGSINPMTGRGSCAETLVIGTDLLAAIPDAIGDDVAACLPVASGTALQALVTIAQLRKGQSLLVSGASGAVGSSAVQIARSIGARVTGVCSTANIAYVRGIGADEVIDYKTTDWRRLGLTFDVILDASGTSTFGSVRRSLSPTGFYLNTFPRPGMFLSSKVVGLISRQHSIPFMLKTDAKQLQELARLAERRVLVPRVAKTVRLEGVATAQREMQEGTIHGKVCVSVTP
jgi:NADPH:quinone reductase-like Zn-dependent oxidoreductase